LAPHRHDAKPDVVGSPPRLEPLPEGRPGGPGVVGPRAAPPRPGTVAGPGGRCRGLRVVQVRVGAAGQPGVVPVPAPLDDATVTEGRNWTRSDGRSPRARARSGGGRSRRGRRVPRPSARPATRRATP